MTPILEQFLLEAREFLQCIGEKMVHLEKEPESAALMSELFRIVHTLKGNSGLFEFPEMTRVLHAAEDLMDAVRDGRITYSRSLTDRLLNAMDFIAQLVDGIEKTGATEPAHIETSVKLAQSLRDFIDDSPAGGSGPESGSASLVKKSSGLESPRTSAKPTTALNALPLADIAESLRMELYRNTVGGGALWLVDYAPEEECFFKGEDPFFLARQIPKVAWGGIVTREAWQVLTELDPYRCNLHFHALTTAGLDTLQDLFRYVPEQVSFVQSLPITLALPQGDPNGGPVYEDFVSDALGLLDKGSLPGLDRLARAMLEISSPTLWLSSALRWLLLVLELDPANRQAQGAIIKSLLTLTPPLWADAAVVGQALEGDLEGEARTPTTPPFAGLSTDDAAHFRAIVEAQREILGLPDGFSWLPGRLKAVAATLEACHKATGKRDALTGLEAALAEALTTGRAAPLGAWLGCRHAVTDAGEGRVQAKPDEPVARLSPADAAPAAPEAEVKFGRRAEDAYFGPKAIKVDQAKIDRLMNLIGEMVVAKNALPYLANRAEAHYGVRELSREIKAQYAVVNRIAEEMQGVIMQVRMMAVSFVFQRFPRLVRDISRKLSKEVDLVLEGEETEADKNIVEALADPLIHIVRNSLDHGIEAPEARRAAGKPEAGRLVIRARQESDRVVIEISDDGKGIDPGAVKRKAFETGLIDGAAMERLTDQEAVNLVFRAGFSTVDAVSDLSGRGVGMDVVSNAIAKVNGTVHIESEPGKGTLVRLSLPMSMAVTNVMIVQSGGQSFGVPMEMVVETVRVARSAIFFIKHQRAAVLRGRIVPLLALNDLISSGLEQVANDDDKFAVLVVRDRGEHVGIVVDHFRETADIILKPMTGVLSGLTGCAGSALLGDGSVLVVLNLKEII